MGIEVTGLDEFRRKVRDIDLNEPMDGAIKETAKAVEADARRRVPTLSGAARSSLQVELSGRSVEVTGGGSRAPYFGWLDFGGSVGRGNSVSRPYRSMGRFIYQALGYQDEEQTLKEHLDTALTDAGLEVE